VGFALVNGLAMIRDIVSTADAATSANRTALVDLGLTAGLAGGVGSLVTATTLGWWSTTYPDMNGCSSGFTGRNAATKDDCTLGVVILHGNGDPER
jgi:hypothetical protein